VVALAAFILGAVPEQAAPAVATYTILSMLVLAISSTSTIVASTVVGAVMEGTTPDVHKVRHVDQRLVVRATQANPLNTTLRMLRRGKKATAEKVEWEEDAVIPRRTATTGATDAGAADAGVNLTIANAGYYLPDDLIMLPANATAPDGLVIVESINTAGNIITVKRWDGGTSTTYGTVPAVGSGEALVRIGNLKEEGYGFSKPRTTMPGQEYNLIEEVDATIAISTRRMNTRNYTINDWTRSRDRQTYDFLCNEELKLFFGKREKKTVTRGGELVNVTSMGGILSFNLPKQLTYSAATLSQANIIEWHRRLFADNAGSQVRYAFIDHQFAADMATVPLDQVERKDYESKILQFGVKETRMAGLGTIRWIPNQAFTVAGKSRLAVILDIANLDWIPFQAMDTTRLTKKQTGKNMEEVNISEAYSMAVRYLDTHMLIEGTA
jgi:hypothetical protein